MSSGQPETAVPESLADVRKRALAAGIHVDALPPKMPAVEAGVAALGRRLIEVAENAAVAGDVPADVSAIVQSRWFELLGAARADEDLAYRLRAWIIGEVLVTLAERGKGSMRVVRAIEMLVSDTSRAFVGRFG